jgi:hypothetical protein
MSHFTRISLGLFRIHKSDAPSYGACIIGDPGATVELREKGVFGNFDQFWRKTVKGRLGVPTNPLLWHSGGGSRWA